MVIRFNPGGMFDFCMDVPLQILKVDHTNTNFSSKNDSFIYQLAQFWLKFWASLPNFSQNVLKFEPILA